MRERLERSHEPDPGGRRRWVEARPNLMCSSASYRELLFGGVARSYQLV